MRRPEIQCIPANILLSLTALFLILAGVLWDYIPYAAARIMLPASGALILLFTALWKRSQRRQE